MEVEISNNDDQATVVQHFTNFRRIQKVSETTCARSISIQLNDYQNEYTVYLESTCRLLYRALKEMPNSNLLTSFRFDENSIKVETGESLSEAPIHTNFLLSRTEFYDYKFKGKAVSLFNARPLRAFISAFDIKNHSVECYFTDRLFSVFEVKQINSMTACLAIYNTVPEPGKGSDDQPDTNWSITDQNINSEQNIDPDNNMISADGEAGGMVEPPSPHQRQIPATQTLPRTRNTGLYSEEGSTRLANNGTSFELSSPRENLSDLITDDEGPRDASHFSPTLDHSLRPRPLQTSTQVVGRSGSVISRSNHSDCNDGDSMSTGNESIVPMSVSSRRSNCFDRSAKQDPNYLFKQLKMLNILSLDPPEEIEDVVDGEADDFGDFGDMSDSEELFNT